MGIRVDNAIALYMEAINDGNYVAAINKYTGERYIQHSTPVKDGRDGFIEFFADFVERNPERNIEILRSFEDGQYVFLHALQTLNGGEFRYITADIFDTDEQGRMIEHWDIIEELTDASDSSPSRIDGPTAPDDRDRTAENKALVTSFLNEVLVAGNVDVLADHVSVDEFVQHNPQITGVAAGVYTEVHRVIGCGSFVAALSKVNAGGTELAVVDLFRVNAGRIAEHWDVKEEILPEADWVNSGKF